MKFRIDLKILFFLVLFYFTGQLKIYLIIMFFALLHELAHLIVGKILKFRITEIEIMPFGLWSSIEPNIDEYKNKNLLEMKKIFISFAGPLLNLIFIKIFLEIKNDELLYANLLLIGLNFIPIYPLDGGRILKCIFRILMEKKKADKIINVIANVFIIILTICGSIFILYYKNIAILLIIAYLWKLVILENKRFELKEKIRNMC